MAAQNNDRKIRYGQFVLLHRCVGVGAGDREFICRLLGAECGVIAVAAAVSFSGVFQKYCGASTGKCKVPDLVRKSKELVFGTEKAVAGAQDPPGVLLSRLQNQAQGSPGQGDDQRDLPPLRAKDGEKDINFYE